MISKKKVNLTSIQNVVNEAFIRFGTNCDAQEMQNLNLSANGNNNLVPSIFLNNNVTFSFDCINNQFDTGDFYTYLSNQIIDLAKTQTMGLFGFIPCPPSFATVTVDEPAIQAAVYRLYYNFNNECGITSNGTLIDFNINGSYNFDSQATAQQVMASFGNCQTTEQNQQEATQQLQAIIDTSTTVGTSWLAWVFVIVIILIILLIIIGIIVGIATSRRKVADVPEVKIPDYSYHSGDFLVERAKYLDSYEEMNK